MKTSVFWSAWILLATMLPCSLISQDFITTWNTQSLGLSNNNQVFLQAEGTYDIYWEDLNDATINGTITNITGNHTITFPSAGWYEVRLSGGLERLYFGSPGATDAYKLISLEQWGNIAWTNMESAFESCINMSYNATDTPDLSNVTNMERMFAYTRMNANINDWDVSNITTMKWLFLEVIQYNQPLDNWVVDNVTDMGSMFSGAKNFNQDITGWNVANVVSMLGMFQEAEDFNQPIGVWTTPNLQTTQNMFRDATSFNQDLSNWDMTDVIHTSGMFQNATAFNQDLSAWDMTDIHLMSRMFSGATNFNQSLAAWDVESAYMLEMLDNCGMDEANYDATLISWASQNVQANNPLGANGLTYCAGSAARQMLVNTYGWTITGDTENCPPPNPFITTWKTDNPGTSNNDQIIIPGIGTYDIYWEEVGNAANSGSINAVSGTHTITFPNPGTYEVQLSGGLTQIRFDNSDDKDKILSIDQWGDVAWQSFTSAFYGCTNLQYNASDAPDLSGATSLFGAFEGASSFNGDLSNWDVSTITTMGYLFNNASSFNQPLNSWVVDQVTYMAGMFGGATSFNQDLSNWNVSNVSYMVGMFANATSFNQDISGWTTSSLTEMRQMFLGASAFNQDISGWDVSGVSNMARLFEKASTFNQDLSAWQFGQVTDMSSMFREATTFNQNIGNWDISSVTTMTVMLSNSGLSKANYDATLIGWANQTVQNNVDLSALSLSYCAGLAARYELINTHGWSIFQDTEDCSTEAFITTWKSDNPGTSNADQITIPAVGTYNISWEDVSNASINGQEINVSGTHTLTFPAPGTYEVRLHGGLTQIKFNNFDDKDKILSIDNWGNMAWLSMNSAFFGCTNLTYNTTSVPDLSQATNAGSMFKGATNFNGNIDNWDVSTITNMVSMFEDATSFNQSLNSWDVSNVNFMPLMFAGASSFNQNLNGWITTNLTNTGGMFANATAYNQPMNNWLMNGVSVTAQMFEGATSFNQDLSSWTTSAITSMANMFDGATAFDQSLAGWDITSVTDMAGMLDNVGLSESNYDATLIGWSGQAVQSNVRLDATALTYCAGATARQNLITTHNWIINGDTENCPVGAFITIWKTDNFGASGNNEVEFPGVGTYDIYWQEVGNSSNSGSINGASGQYTITFPSIGTYEIQITGGLQGINFGLIGDKRKLLSIDQWGVIQWSSLTGAFEDCDQMTMNASDAPDLSLITDLSFMFHECTNLDGNFNSWNVSQVTNLSGMFKDCPALTSDFNNWDVSQVTSMAALFNGCTSFNGDIENWVTSNVTDMSETLRACPVFNRDIGGWDVAKVTNMRGMFAFSDIFNQDLNSWVVSSVTDMTGTFSHAFAFNGDISSWDVSKVTTMLNMFFRASSFNADISGWDVGDVENISSMFFEATSFNQPIGAWEVLFTDFMRGVFQGATSFNQPLGSFWGRAEDLSNMFNGATSFNQDLNWAIGYATTNMSNMFKGATSFNGDISGWDTGDVTNMSNMFEGATSFNQDIGSWDVKKVTNFTGMFKNASSFDQDLGNWDTRGMNTINTDEMFDNCGLSVANYDALLIGWNGNISQLGFGISMDVAGLEYCNGSAARQNLINTRNWIFTGDSESCPDRPFITTWDTNNTGTSSNNEITIPAMGSYDIAWEEVGNASNSGVVPGVSGTYTLSFPSPGIYQVSLSNGINGFSFNNTGDKRKLLTIEQWGDIQWASLSGAFFGCNHLTYNAIDQPDLTFAADLSFMFRNASLFNGDITTWDVSGVVDMNNMFYGADAFNQDISGWNTGSVTDMSSMFFSANIFNQPIGSWDVSQVDNMEYMFAFTDAFNQDLTGWIFTQSPDITNIFRDATAFNGNISNWNIFGMTSLEAVFYGAENFNQDISGWNTRTVTSLRNTFFGATVFDQPIGSWNTLNVTDMQATFRDAANFNQNLNNWQTGSVTNMREMFRGATVFNQPLNNWNVSQVTNTVFMFFVASAFDQDLSGWVTTSLTDMHQMFYDATAFNQDISSWDVSGVDNMERLFKGASNFNQDLSTWDVSSVTDMDQMFEDAVAFNQSLGAWNITAVTSMVNMLNDCALSISNYDQTLIGWEGQAVQSNVNLGAAQLYYCQAAGQRGDLINNDGWTIAGDSEDCAALPVELTSFSATAQEAFNLIEWSTSSEYQTSHFELLSSNNGIDWFLKEILVAEGAGLGSQHYQVEDSRPFEVTYYRLRMIDLDDSYELSPVVVVDRAAFTPQIILYPNPTTNYVMIQNAEGQSVRLYNQLGQLVISSIIEKQSDRLDLMDLPPGIYYLHTQRQQSYRLVKQ